MTYTQEQLIRDGYCVPPAPVDDWRRYDEDHPVPNYFDFDWFSARHPDLYDRFAISTIGLMDELERLLDLSGLEVIDVGAGTGRSAAGAARKAKRVTAVDVFESVVFYGRERVRRMGLDNVDYLRASRDGLPFAGSSFDALINSWAELNCAEAYRVLKPGGYLVRMGGPLNALCGELTQTLKDVFPHIIQDVPPAEWFDPACPQVDEHIMDDIIYDVPVIPPTFRHDFTYISDYGDYTEAAAIFGRLYGPKARQYIVDRRLSRFAWRLRIEIMRVRK